MSRKTLLTTTDACNDTAEQVQDVCPSQGVCSYKFCPKISDGHVIFVINWPEHIKSIQMSCISWKDVTNTTEIR